jgi:TonB family protein
MENHPQNQLSEFFDQRLDAAAQALVQSHVAHCEKCAEELRHMATLRQSLKAIPQVQPDEVLYARVKSRVAPEPAPSLLARLGNIWESGLPAFAASAVMVLIGAGIWHELARPALPRPETVLNWDAREVRAKQVAPVRAAAFSPSKKSRKDPVYQITGAIAERPILKKVMPQCAAAQPAEMISGVIEVEFMVDPAGAVQPDLRVKRTTGSPALDTGATQALRQWQFVPSHRSDSGSIRFDLLNCF